MNDHMPVPVEVMLMVRPVAVAVTSHVYRYAVQYDETTIDCRTIPVPVPSHVGALSVRAPSSEKAWRTSMSPLVTSNVGDSWGVAADPNPTAGCTARTRVGGVTAVAALVGERRRASSDIGPTLPD
jgi:hypothetical protein